MKSVHMFLTWWLNSRGLVLKCLLHWLQVSLIASLRPPSASFGSWADEEMAWVCPGRMVEDMAEGGGTSGGTEEWLGWWPGNGTKEEWSWGMGGTELATAKDPCLERSLEGGSFEEEVPLLRSGWDGGPDFCKTMFNYLKTIYNKKARFLVV